MDCARRLITAGQRCVLVLLCLLSAAPDQRAQSSATTLNLNTATVAQLETLPGIGAALARRIIEHRQKHGAFKRPSDIIVIRGMSAKRYRLIAPLVRTE